MIILWPLCRSTWVSPVKKWRILGSKVCCLHAFADGS